jgi:DNA-binding response OmpR family regulator
VARILLVDDDADLIEGQKAYLEKNGYQVESAMTIEEGVARAASFCPQLIIADLMMQHYDSGFVFCRKVRDVPGMEKVPIIMQTAAPRKVGFTFDPGSPSGRDWMKADEVLTKPVPLEHLLGKIELHLSRTGKAPRG